MNFFTDILENVINTIIDALTAFIENLILGFILPFLESFGI